MKPFCVLMFSVVSICCYAQKEKEIVDRYRIALMKVAEASAEVQSMFAEGNFRVQNLSFPGRTYVRGKAMRMEFTFQNMNFLTISNDSLKYEYNPLTKESKLTKINDGNQNGSRGNKESFDFMRLDLLEYEKRDLPLRLVKKLKVDSIDTYKLELGLEPRSRKKKAFIYINVKNNLIYKIEDANGTRYFMNYFTDHHNGYVFPKHIVESSAKQSIEAMFSRFDFNVTLADSLFVIPKGARPAPGQQVIALEKAGDSLFRAGNYSAAKAKYSEAIRLYAESPTLFNARGRAKMETGHYYEAIGDFTSAVELDSTFGSAYNNRGLAKSNLKDGNGAVEDYTKAIRYSPGLIVFRNRGSAYLLLQKWNEATNDFGEALKIKADDPEALYKYGLAQAQLEHYDVALRFYKRAIDNGFPLNEINNYRGVSYYAIEQYDSAVMCFKKAVDLDPDHKQYAINYVHALYELQDYKSALRQLEISVKKDPANPELHNLMGLCMYRDEHYQAAAIAFSKAIELNGSNNLYFSNRASAKEEIEDYEGAIADYSASIALYPNDASNFYKRGLLKLRTSKKIEGCQDLGTAHEMQYEPAKEAIMKHCH